MTMKSNALKTTNGYDHIGLYPVGSGDVKKLEIYSGLFNVFMKLSPNLAWVADEDSRLVFGNPSFYNYFGLKEEEAAGKFLTDLVPAEVVDALYKKHIEVLHTGKPVELLEKVKWPNGTQ